jgi:serine/threonine protein kinase
MRRRGSLALLSRRNLDEEKACVEIIEGMHVWHAKKGQGVVFKAESSKLIVVDYAGGERLHYDEASARSELSATVAPLPVASRFVEAVLSRAHAAGLSVKDLAYATDSKGRCALDVATSANRHRLYRDIMLLGRYKQIGNLHVSETSVVFKVQDMLADEGAPIFALKQMQSADDFLREVGLRADHGLSPEYVVALERVHEDNRAILMRFAESSLEDAMIKDGFAGVNADAAHIVVSQVVTAVKHLHDKGIVHGDIKPRNAVRADGTTKLIDLDGSAAIGGPVGRKVALGHCPANAPPEYAAHCFQARWSSRVISDLLSSEGVSLNSVRKQEWEQCQELSIEIERAKAAGTLSAPVASASFDIWALGVLFYRMFTGSELFRKNVEDDIDDEDDLRRLVLWSGIDEPALRKRVFSKAQSAAVSALEKDLAVALVSACLEPEPQARPQSIDDLLKLPYFRLGRDASLAKLLFVSTPGKGYNPETATFDLDVMGILQSLCRAHVGHMMVAYDWAGSSSGDPRDTPLFDKIFTTIRADGKTLFNSWAAATSPQDKEALIDLVQDILYDTRWLSSYRGSIKAQIRQVCQGHAKAILIRIDGGPITRVEARILPSLIAEAKADLASLGFAEVDIELYAFETIFDFLEALPNFMDTLQVYSQSTGPRRSAVQQPQPSNVKRASAATIFRTRATEIMASQKAAKCVAALARGRSCEECQAEKGTVPEEAVFQPVTVTLTAGGGNLQSSESSYNDLHQEPAVRRAPEQAQAKIDALQAAVEAGASEVERLRAQLEQARAELEEARAEAEQTGR